MKKLRMVLLLVFLGAVLFSLTQAEIYSPYLGLDMLHQRSQAIVIARIPPPPPPPDHFADYDPTNGTHSSIYQPCDISIVKVIKGEQELPKERKKLPINLGFFPYEGKPDRLINPALIGEANAALNLAILDNLESTQRRMFPKPGELYLLFLMINPNRNEAARWQNVNISGSALLLDPPAVRAKAKVSSATLELRRQALAPLKLPPQATDDEQEKAIRNEVIRVIIAYLTTDHPERVPLIRQFIEP